MILREQHPVTGQPRIREDRQAGVRYHALPRKYYHFAVKPETKQQTWVGDWMAWSFHMLQRVRCWKCGRDIKGWRVALDFYAQPITVAGQPAVTFGLFDHYRQTPMQAYLPTIEQLVSFSVLHCADCVIENGHALEAVTCYLQGLDAQLQQAWQYRQGTQLTRDAWATHLSLWQHAEPVGVGEGTMALTLDSLNKQLVNAKRENKGAVTLPTPGEMVTAAHYLLDVHGWSLTGSQTGMQVRYAGAQLAGYLPADGRAVDPAQYPALAQLMPVLPTEPGWWVKI